MERIIIVGLDNIGKCEYCGKENEDLRPYGKNGARICYDCGMKPGNIKTTNAMFSGILNGDSEKPTKEQQN